MQKLVTLEVMSVDPVQKKKTYTVLLLDPDPVFAKRLQSDKNFQQIEILHFQSGKETQKFVANEDEEIGRVFINPEVDDISWISVIRFIKQKRPDVPIYLITEKDVKGNTFGLVEFDRLGVTKVFSKQSDYKELLKAIAPIAQSFDSSSVDAALAGAKAPDTDDDFFPIRARDFLSGMKGLFDVYVRLSATKYVKLVHRGDTIDHDRVISYLEKGVSHFYIQKEMQGVYTEYCAHLATKLAEKKEIDAITRSNQNMNFGQRILESAAANGMTPEVVKNAQKFVANLSTLTKEVKGSGAGLIQLFVSNAASYEHGSGVAALAGVLAASMNIASDNPVQIVGVAALFHDIGLLAMPKHFQEEDPTKMTPEEASKFKTHPQIGAEIIRRTAVSSPVVLQAIEQHHMRLKNKGFPERTGGTLVNKVSDIIGICDDYIRAVNRAKADPTLDLIKEIEDEILPGFPRDIGRAFMSTFYPARIR